MTKSISKRIKESVATGKPDIEAERLADLAPRMKNTLERLYALSFPMNISLKAFKSSDKVQPYELKSVLENINPMTQLIFKIEKMARADWYSEDAISRGIKSFIQGIAGGRFDREEIISIIENLPCVANHIANEMHLTIGGLVNYVSDGQLMSSDICKIFEIENISKDDITQYLTMVKK